MTRLARAPVDQARALLAQRLPARAITEILLLDVVPRVAVGVVVIDRLLQ